MDALNNVIRVWKKIIRGKYLSRLIKKRLDRLTPTKEERRRKKRKGGGTV